MPKYTLGLGIALAAIGIVGYLLAMFSDYASWTALIPAMMGAIFVIIGAGAFARAGWRKHLMHAAVAFAVFCILLMGMPIMRVLTAETMNVVSAASILLTTLLLVAYVALGIKSFIDARRARQQGIGVGTSA